MSLKDTSSSSCSLVVKCTQLHFMIWRASSSGWRAHPPPPFEHLLFSRYLHWMTSSLQKFSCHCHGVWRVLSSTVSCAILDSKLARWLWDRIDRGGWLSMMSLTAEFSVFSTPLVAQPLLWRSGDPLCWQYWRGKLCRLPWCWCLWCQVSTSWFLSAP